MSASILAPDHNPFAFLISNPDYRTAPIDTLGKIKKA